MCRKPKAVNNVISYSAKFNRLARVRLIAVDGAWACMRAQTYYKSTRWETAGHASAGVNNSNVAPRSVDRAY